MTLTMINQMEDKVQAFFEWWTEWSCKGDKMECVYDDDYGTKVYIVYDCTGMEKCRFNTECGILNAYIGKAQPQK